MSAAVDLLTFGESMVSLRSPGPLSAGGSLGMHVAGAESNVAVGIARLGHTVTWAGVLGADPHCEFILRQLRSEGLGVRHRVDPSRSTGVMFLEQRTADVSRAFYYRAGSAGSTLRREDIEPVLDSGAKVLHLTGITAALGPQPLDAVEYAAERAASEGVLVSLDVNYRSKLWSREEARTALASIVRHADVVIASEDELDLLAPDHASLGVGNGGSDAAEATMAAGLLDSGVREVVVKRGAAGACAYTVAGRLEQRAVPVTSIDTVGAGDAFTAGYLSAVLDGEDVAGRLQRGVLAGAFAVSTAGDWEGLPHRGELGLLGAHPSGSTQR
ncbi:sugar kinase [Arthrobacter sp. MMS18-M83]|uniref:sugar kinase n=1 Tax=Arthrobacter sp. MMS18-M83 TaxID=2996261 RepID=UPI00227CC7AD|nr:sugar kinase [Arthrobacter sp. MMS18-M83]WAH96033.1 sugar kinase [Arthrobacter sp. MMS18-M83]